MRCRYKASIVDAPGLNCRVGTSSCWIGCHTEPCEFPHAPQVPEGAEGVALVQSMREVDVVQTAVQDVCVKALDCE